MEFEHRLVAVDDLAQVAEIIAAKDVACSVEISEDLVAALLRRVDHGRVEHRILRKQVA